MRRFWTKVEIEPAPGTGYALALDGRTVRTPGKALCAVPSRALADALAEEWAAVEGEIDPRAMPLTRAANTAIDRVTGAEATVSASLAAYGETDLLCYRAPHPPALAARQAAAWDPMLDWAEAALGARLATASGVIHVPQDPAALERLAALVAAHGAWELTALHELVTLSGSLVLGLAVSHGRLSAEAAWPLSRIDEDWNIEQWGEDAEEAAATARRRAAFHGAERLMHLIRLA